MKTCPQGLQGLANQGFGQIAQQMGIFIKSNKIKDLADLQKRQEGHAAQNSDKVVRPFFVHKSRGKVGIFAKKPHFWRVCVLAEFFGFQALLRKWREWLCTASTSAVTCS
ncbi:hypothetical protein, partial [Limnohabitans sp.]|uniref:hypothetical protein n=1 Tax=Limnohabitans sp. TaxID=1907725 RepID=UPI0033422666